MLEQFLKDHNYKSAAELARAAGISLNSMSRLRNAKSILQYRIETFVRIKRVHPSTDLTKYWPELKELTE